MKRIALVLFVLIFLSCDDEFIYDKEIRLSFRFPNGGIEGFSTETSLLSENVFLRKFNKSDYPKLKSITFSVFAFGPDPDPFYIELYNDTDGEVIANSVISTASSQYDWVDSENVIANLPDKTIDLSLAVHSGNNTGNCGLLDAELILRRD